MRESYTPETMPMSRFAEYARDLAELLGEKASVHFVSVEESSMAFVQDIEHEAYPKVRDRVHSVKRGEGPGDALSAYHRLNRKLAEDHAIGELVEEPSPEDGQLRAARVLDFPGRRQEVASGYGPITQAGTLQGVVIMVGGESDPVPVHLRDVNRTHICTAKRDLSRELARFYDRSPLRVFGRGRWLRTEEGEWQMRSFRIERFVELLDDSLSDVRTHLQGMPGDWKTSTDTLDILRDLRVGDA